MRIFIGKNRLQCQKGVKKKIALYEEVFISELQKWEGYITD
jgi:hypothetical protein